MSSLEPSRFGLRSAVVTVLCLLGAGTGGYLLYRDLNRSGADGQGPPLAKVERREAKARRKTASSFAWSNLLAEQSLFRRDSVQTGAGSAASIRFTDGTVVELGENSLVVIDEIERLSLDFLKGSVILHTAEGDKRVSVGADGKAKLEELPIRLVRPEPLYRFFTRTQEAKEVRFAWKSRAGVALPAGLALQVSPDRAFRGPKVRSLPIAATAANELSATLPAGIHFWRLVAVEDGGPRVLTEPGQFRVVEASPLKPVSPALSEKLVSFGAPAPIQFRWSAPSDDPSAGSQVEHFIDISRDPAFQALEATQAILPSSGMATLSGLPDGAYLWRIRSRYADLTVASRAEAFQVIRAQRPTLALLYPPDRKTLEIAPQVRLSWSSDAPGLEYSVELQSAHGAPIAAQRGFASGYLWKQPLSGSFRWRVSAIHQGVEIAQTEWSAFTVFEGARLALRAPLRGQEIRYWEKPVGFSFAWDADPLLGEHADYAYQVEVTPDGVPSGPARVASPGPRVRETSLESASLGLRDGAYAWRVHVVDGAGGILKSSEPSRFTYGVFPPLNAPSVSGPAAGHVYDLSIQEEEPALSWVEVPDAVAYEVTLYAREASGRSPASSIPGAPAGFRVASRFVTRKTNAELKGLAPADYAWSVRAIDRLKRRGEPIPPREFQVTHGEPLGSPEVTTPEVQ